MFKYLMVSLLTLMTISSCSSGPPTKNVIGLSINKVISSKHYPYMTLLDNGYKQYTVEQRTEPSAGMDNCTPAINTGDSPICSPGIGMDGSETTTIYTVNKKGIITDVTQSYEFIPFSGPSLGWRAVKPEEPALPKYTPEQDKSVSDFFDRVHR